jgi:hypothetical protein
MPLFSKQDGEWIRKVDVNAPSASKRVLDTSAGGGGSWGSTANPSVVTPSPISSEVPISTPGGGSSNPSTPIIPTKTNQVDPMDAYNQLTLGLLKSAQGMNTADLLKKKRALERGSLERSSEITPEELRTLSPGQQESIRSGKVQALQPDIDANAYELEKANQSIDNFFKVFDQASKISQDFAEKMQAPQSVIDNAIKVIHADPEKMSTVLSGFNDKSKQAILGSLDYSKMGSTKTPKTRPTETVEVNGKKLLIDSETGETIKELGSVTGAGSSGYGAEKAGRAVSAVDELMPRVNWSTVGPGAMAKLVPGTPAMDFATDLDHLKSSIAFNELSDMREASKTGGALGNVSEKELVLLESALAGLNQFQSPENLRKNLLKAKESITRWQNVKAGITESTPAASTRSQPQSMTLPNGTVVRLQADGTYE